MLDDASVCMLLRRVVPSYHGALCQCVRLCCTIASRYMMSLCRVVLYYRATVHCAISSLLIISAFPNTKEGNCSRVIHPVVLRVYVCVCVIGWCVVFRGCVSFDGVLSFRGVVLQEFIVLRGCAIDYQGVSSFRVFRVTLLRLV